ncbi:MAG: permease prefix domain 1-containing protein, partial [Gemmatimonadaceae bacterium]
MMRMIRRSLQRLGNADREKELDDEVNFHLAMDINARIATGTAPDEARRQAMAIFGSAAGHKDGMREARPTHWLEEMLRDARLALRSMRRAPAFTALVILTLGIGIGAST